MSPRDQHHRSRLCLAPLQPERHDSPRANVRFIDFRGVFETLRPLQDAISAIAHEADVLIWTTSRSGACRVVSQGLSAFTGRPTHRLYGFDWLQALHPDERPLVFGCLWDAAQAKRAFASTVRLQRDDGQYRWLLATFTPVVSTQGRHLGHVAIAAELASGRQVDDRLVAELVPRLLAGP